MLAHARINVPRATFAEAIPDEQFDLIVSLIVLQHVPIARGGEIIRTLLSLLRSGGTAVLQVPTRRKGGVFGNAARWLRARVPLVHRVASAVEGDSRGLPYMEMNAYDLTTLRGEIDRTGCVLRHVEGTNHGGIEGVILVARKL